MTCAGKVGVFLITNIITKIVIYLDQMQSVWSNDAEKCQ